MLEATEVTDIGQGCKYMRSPRQPQPGMFTSDQISASKRCMNEALGWGHNTKIQIVTSEWKSSDVERLLPSTIVISSNLKTPIQKYCM